MHQGAGLRLVTVPTNRPAPTRIPWRQVPSSFREDVKQYLTWASVPDPLAEGARARALAPLSLRLQQTHIHSAASAAAAAGIPLDQIISLASLVEPETFRALLRHLLAARTDRKLSAYTHGVAVTLIAIASDWVKASAGCDRDPQDASEQARNVANRLDRKEPGAVAQVRRPATARGLA